METSMVSEPANTSLILPKPLQVIHSCNCKALNKWSTSIKNVSSALKHILWLPIRITCQNARTVLGPVVQSIIKAPLLADLFLYLYEAEFVQCLLQAGKKHLAQQFSFTYRYIDDVLSLKNSKLQSIWNSSIHVNLK